MREIVLDTETTGLDPKAGHRIVEIGCVELRNGVPTGQTWHAYVNPEREMPEDAFRVHGLSTAFLADQPVFAAVAAELEAFVGEAPLVIHNAAFDLGFLNAELERSGRQVWPESRTIDTVAMARARFPGAPASLDALARRFGIDLSAREKHGALLDASILAAVYLELTGGREPGLELAAVERADGAAAAILIERPVRPPRPHLPSTAELAAHAAFLAAAVSEPIWLR